MTGLDASVAAGATMFVEVGDDFHSPDHPAVVFADATKTDAAGDAGIPKLSESPSEFSRVPDLLFVERRRQFAINQAMPPQFARGKRDAGSNRDRNRSHELFSLSPAQRVDL